MNNNFSDIERFIVWDYIDAYKRNGSTKIQSNLIRWYQFQAHINRKYKYIIYVNKMYNYLLSTLKHEKTTRKIIFYSLQYPLTIVGINKQYSPVLIAFGKKDIFFSVKNFMNYFTILDLYQFIAKYFKENNVRYLNELLDKIETKLKKEMPEYIVLNNDSLPLERSIILASRKLGITTIVIQHGIYPNTSQLTDGLVADYVFVWGQFFKNIYVNHGIRTSDKVYILGYPYKIEKKGYPSDEKITTVIYLGQDYDQYDSRTLSFKLNTLNKIKDLCSNLNLIFYYKPHPNDDIKILQEKLPEMNIFPKTKTLVDTFKFGDIFISFNSSSLVEAYMHSKICIQFMDSQFIDHHHCCDNFEELGVCSKSLNNMKDLKQYLEFIIKSDKNLQSKFNNEYIDISKNIGESFLNILHDIENKNISSNQESMHKI